MFLILAVVFMVASAVMSQAQTNSAALALPPADWDASKHILAALVATNRPGQYPLPHAWVGVEKVTTRTGWFTRKSTEVLKEQADKRLEFDRFNLGPGRAPARLREERFLSAGARGVEEAWYRASLPSDAELLGMRDISSVSNLFGWNPLSWGTNLAIRTVGVRYFTLRPYDSIETVQATFMVRGQQSGIDSILVKRARLHPQPKK